MDSIRIKPVLSYRNGAKKNNQAKQKRGTRAN